MDYRAKEYSHLKGLAGIPDSQVELHVELYTGYVKNTNLLTGKLDIMRQDERMGDPEFSELKRRLGFEMNGMRLHEYYFDNLKPGGGDEAPEVLSESWGSFEAWRNEFTAVGTMRGVGWAITWLDPVAMRLTNNWITMHEVGNLAGFEPILVMDMWEHAFMGYLKPAQRKTYIDHFFSNIDWQTVTRRLQHAATQPV